MSKIISFNPELLSLSHNSRGSRKKRPDESSQKIKVRTPKEKTKTFRKNHVLRFIRDQQEKNYKRLLENDPSAAAALPAIHMENTDESGDFKSNFDESLKYLLTLTEENEKNIMNMGNGSSVMHNQTMRRQSSHPVISTDENVSLDFPAESFEAEPAMRLLPPVLHSQPAWGCLKNGQLPTLRTWRNITQRNTPGGMARPLIQPPAQISQIFAPTTTPMPMSVRTHTPIPTLTHTNFTDSSRMMSSGEQIRIQEMKQHAQHAEKQRNPKNRMHYPTQKRTVRRTYRVGKSKIYPKVTVLVSNRTIRNNITTKTQLMKQAPIDEIKRYLVKNGFIRVGSSAPNDVLRKMYETASLMCGEIRNHNPDNLLYNFLHDDNTNTTLTR